MDKTFPLIYQTTDLDCGPAVLFMISRYYNKSYTLDQVYSLCDITRNGISAKALSAAAKAIGFKTIIMKYTFDSLVTHFTQPIITLLKSHHFVVIFKIHERHIYIADPMEGRVRYTYKQFHNKWMFDKDNQGILIGIRPMKES